jgi:hypothetical protein
VIDADMSAPAMDLRDSDFFGIAIVIATILVSALCYAFILHTGIVIAE